MATKTSTYLRGKFYLRPMYCAWAWGPFDSADAAKQFKKDEIAKDPYFDYEPCAVLTGEQLGAPDPELEALRAEMRAEEAAEPAGGPTCEEVARQLSSLNACVSAALRFYGVDPNILSKHNPQVFLKGWTFDEGKVVVPGLLQITVDPSNPSTKSLDGLVEIKTEEKLSGSEIEL